MPNINYKLLSSNPNALDILLDYMIENDNFYDKIFTVRVPNSEILYSLIYNPSLFEIDYMRMAKKRTKIIYYELMKKAMAPNRIKAYLDYHLEQGYDIIDFDAYN